MSDKLPPLEIFPIEEIISIKISGGFYVRLSQLLTDHISSRDPKEIAQIFADLATREPKDSFEYHLLTITVLIKEIESVVRAENKFELIDPSTFQTPDADSDLDSPQSQSQPESQD
jgi:hypothetical protein